MWLDCLVSHDTEGYNSNKKIITIVKYTSFIRFIL